MRITNLTRSALISTSTSDATTTTVTTVSSHSMVTGDKVSFPGTPIKSIATVTGASTFTVPNIPTTVGQTLVYTPTGEVYINEFRAADVAVSVGAGSSANNAATFQVIGSTTAGSGAASVDIEVSNDNSNWMKFSTVTLVLGVTTTTDGVVLDAPWGFVRSRVTSISGTNAKVTVLLGKN